jgi:hypothetical protein
MTEGMEMKLNPNNEVTQAMDEQWQKIAGLIMHKLGKNVINISMDDLTEMSQAYDGYPVIVVIESPEFITVKLVTYKEGQKLAKQHGGLAH